MRTKRLISLLALLLAVTMLPIMVASAESFYYVVTGNHKPLNMRAGMSTDDPVITTIPYGAQVGWIGLCDDPKWASVYYGDNNGYVMVRYLSTQKPSASSGSSTSSSTEGSVSYKSFVTANYYATVTPSTPTGHVNLRWGPSKSTGIHGTYTQGATLRVIAENKTWAQVLDEDTLTCGFMLKSFLH